MTRTFNFRADLAIFGSVILAILALVAGWVTNVIWTFNQTDAINVILGILGCLVAPIGALHGIYTWF